MRSACDRVIEFTSAKRFASYESDTLLRSGVERQIEIAAEALIQLLPLNPR